MAGAHPEGDAQYELQRVVEGELVGTNYGYGPGSYAYWSLAHHVVARDVLFADLAPDREQTTYSSRSGRVFIVTSKAFVIAAYRNAAEDDERDPNQDFGTIDLTFHTRRPDSIVALEWLGRSLRIPVDHYGRRPVGPKLPPDSLTLKAVGWEITLPGHTQDDGDGYVGRLRAALDL